MPSAVFSVVLAVLALGYPLAVYFGLQYMEPRAIGLLLVGLFGLRLFAARKQISDNFQLLLPALLLALGCSLAAVLLNSHAMLKLMPCLVNYASCIVFAGTLWRSPSMIERFARLTEPDLDERGVIYTRKVTMAWCVFFLANGSVALYTAVGTSMELWTLYNGLIAYLLMGLFFAVEYAVRLLVRSREAP